VELLLHDIKCYRWRFLGPLWGQKSGSERVSGNCVRENHHMQRLFAGCTEWMQTAQIGDARLGVEKGPIVGHSVINVVTHIILMKTPFPVQQVPDKFIRIAQHLCLSELRRKSAMRGISRWGPDSDDRQRKDGKEMGEEICDFFHDAVDFPQGERLCLNYHDILEAGFSSHEY
jgi:hypothetical protein